VPDLIATPALDKAPVTRGGVTLSVADLGAITSIAPFSGHIAAVSAALRPLGLPFPEANRTIAVAGARIVWTGRAQALLIGMPAPDLAGIAATTDQTDGWVALRLTGAAAAEALMRLVPLDLRAAAFPPGHAARSGLNHLPLILWREDDGFVVLTFRSMARTAWHEIGAVLDAADARARLAART
jgi:heterotetrameric sarcosine oxidase gamma subunit